MPLHHLERMAHPCILCVVQAISSDEENWPLELRQLPRFHSASGSMSSTASGPRSGSYASTTLSIGASSITSMNSYGRLSPGGLSPVPTDGSDSPYVTSLSLNPSPRGSLSRTNHNRALSETKPIMASHKLSDGIGHSNQNGTSNLQGTFICECCPKKPKKFDSQEELK